MIHETAVLGRQYISPDDVLDCSVHVYLRSNYLKRPPTASILQNMEVMLFIKCHIMEAPYSRRHKAYVNKVV